MSRPPVRLTARGYYLLSVLGSLLFLLAARPLVAAFVIGVG